MYPLEIVEAYADDDAIVSFSLNGLKSAHPMPGTMNTDTEHAHTLMMSLMMKFTFFRCKNGDMVFTVTVYIRNVN